MKKIRFIAMMLVLVMLSASLIACTLAEDESTDQITTEAPSADTTAPEATEPDETTEAPVETTEAPVETTEAPVETTEAPKVKLADITFTKSQSIAAGTALANIDYNGKKLTGNYVLSGKLDITGTGTNPHIQFGILDNGNNRILLWDNETKGTFKLCIPYDTNVPAEDIYTFTAGQTLTIEWKIVCHNDYVYFYVGNELKLVYTAINNTKSFPLTLGSEAVDCRFYDMEALTLEDDKADYEAAIAAMNDTITKYSQHTTFERLRAD